MLDPIKMDYLVSDIVNSNIPAYCLKCAVGVSRQPPIMCGTCRSGLGCQLVNSNSLLQTRQDLSLESGSTRHQWSSRVQQSLSRISSTQHPHGLVHLSGSSSSNNSHFVSPSNSNSKQLHPVPLYKGQNCSNDIPVDSEAHESCTSSSCTRLECCHSSCDCHPASGLSENNNNHDCRLCSYTRHNGLSSCAHPACDSPSSVDSVQVDSWTTSSKTSRGQSNNGLSNLSPSSPKLQTLLAHAAVDGTTIISESDESTRSFHSCLSKSQELVPASNHLNPQEVSPVKHEPELLQRPNNISGDLHVFARQHPSCCLDTTHNRQLDTIHNRQLDTTHNRQRNSLTKLSTIKDSIKSGSSRNIHASLRLDALPNQGIRDSPLLKTTFPRIQTLDFPFPSLLPEEFYDIHDLDHENDDLSAEVVFSLHFRNYQIREVLGKGISSTVRRVTEKATGIEYAVKIIDISGEKGEPDHVEQVKKDTFREIQILRMCSGHSNIIELHDVFETSTFIFLVFEICKKGELFDYLTSVVSLSEKRTRIFMRQLIEAVAFFHEKNIVHRDLKPENILLDDALNIKVSDFGFAIVVAAGKELSELCGTPGYLAPEVLAHSMYENVSGYNKEVDMWACGVIMYTLLCGAPPFWNRRQMMMLRAIMSADYTFNSPEWDDITEAPKDLIRNLLVVNPSDRLTAQEALQHAFFQSQDEHFEQYERVRKLSSYYGQEMQLPERKKFNALRKFRAGVHSVVFNYRLSFYSKHPSPVSIHTVRNNPYGVKLMRKVIDTCAFGMYKHWVKRVDNQNRAALFEHTLRDDWKHTLITDGIKA